MRIFNRINKEVINKEEIKKRYPLTYKDWPEMYEEDTIPIRNNEGELMLPNSGWYKELVEHYLLNNGWRKKSRNVYYKEMFQINLARKSLEIKCLLQTKIVLPKPYATYKEFLDKGYEHYTTPILEIIFEQGL